jgi:hypothetical protein
MTEDLQGQIEKLMALGEKMVFLGGFDFSGYNARLQDKYLEWRKSCLQILDRVGPIGFPAKSKLLADQNGGHFYQSSAHLILSAITEVFDKLQKSPDLSSGPSPSEETAHAPETPATSAKSRTRVIKPPSKRSKQGAAPEPKSSDKEKASVAKVYVIGEETDPLRQELSQFVKEMGLEEIPLERKHGHMLNLDKLKHHPGSGYAFFVFNTDDLAYAMFEVGHFVGRLGTGRVCVLHMSDVEFPRKVPGVLVKPIVVKLEEASLSLIRELKAAGYHISI